MICYIFRGFGNYVITLQGISIKITVFGILALVIAVLIVSQSGDVSEPAPVVQGDVIMPTKVSRPGCEKTDGCYVPSVIVVGLGEQVTWVNEDSAFHSVTSGFYDSPTDLFDSGHMNPSESYTLDFDQAGTFDYFCTLHPWMQGQVIVE